LEAATLAFFISDHHGEIHVVEVAEAEQLGLAAEELEPSRAGLLDPPLDIAVFFRGDREEDHPAGQVLEGARLAEPHGRAQQPRHLGIVAAGVSGAGLGIGDRMSRDHQAVQLAEQREGRAVLDARGLGPHAGEGKAAPRLEPELTERLLGQPRGLELLEAELRLAADALPQTDDALGVPVDGLAHRVLKLFLSRHWALTPR
jgi:hypothetical protein